MSELRNVSVSHMFTSLQDLRMPDHREHLQRHLLNKLVQEIPLGARGIITVSYEELDTKYSDGHTDIRCVVEWEEVKRDRPPG